MLELKKAGLYIANGKNVSVLIKVTGEAPMLDIVSGVLLNDMERDGTITKLDQDSFVIQDILMNPKNYIFDLPAVSDAIKGDPMKETNKSTDMEDFELENLIDTYRNLRNMYPEKYIIKMQAVIIGKGYSKSQADIIIRQIESKIRLRTRL